MTFRGISERYPKVKVSSIFSEFGLILFLLKIKDTLTLGDLSEIPREVIVQAFVYKTKPCASLREVLQQIRERMEAIAKGIGSDHWSTVI